MGKVAGALLLVASMLVLGEVSTYTSIEEPGHAVANDKNAAKLRRQPDPSTFPFRGMTTEGVLPFTW